MLSNIKELKEFILWCKSNKIKHFSNESIKFELSDLSFIEDMNSIQPQSEQLEQAQPIENPNYADISGPDLLDTNLNEMSADDQEALYWSTNS